MKTTLTLKLKNIDIRTKQTFFFQMSDTRNSSGRKQSSSNENNRLKKNKTFNIIKQEIEEKGRKISSRNQVIIESINPHILIML